MSRGVFREVSMDGGCTVCHIRLFKSVQLQFLTSRHGLIKIFELLLVLLCQKIIYDFGIAEHRGQRVLQLFYTVVSVALFQSCSFLLLYCLSAHTYRQIRSSLLEITSTALIVAGCVISLLCLCARGGYFETPSRFWSGRPNETNETMLYYGGVMLLFSYCYDGFLVIRSFNALNKSYTPRFI